MNNSDSTKTYLSVECPFKNHTLVQQLQSLCPCFIRQYSLHLLVLMRTMSLFNKIALTFCQQHTTAGLLLKLSRVGPGQFLDGRPDAAGSGVGGPVGITLSSGLEKNIPMSQGRDWGHCPVKGAVFRMGR